MNNNEYTQVITELKQLEGSLLQYICLSQGFLDLGFWKESQLSIFRASFCHKNHFFLPLKDSKTKRKSLKKPLYTFLEAHAFGAELASSIHLSSFGRVMKLEFVNRQEDNQKKIITVELRLFPQGKNIIVRADNKQVSLFSVKELESHPDVEFPVQRSLQELQEVYLSQGSTIDFSVKEEDYKALHKKKLTKIQKVIDKVKLEKQKTLKNSEIWKKTGEELLINQELKVSEEFTNRLDLKKSFSWNLDSCFSHSKKLKAKEKGYDFRILELEKESLEVKDYKIWKKLFDESLSKNKQGIHSPKSSRRHGDSLKKAQFRSLQIESGHLVRVGQSARQNLLLLRGSKAWDFWMHLRDRPGAHAVIGCKKNEILEDSQLISAAQFLLKIHFGNKYKNYIGEVFSVIVAECRYVKTIKGDKLGRVTYSNEKNISVKFNL